MKRAEKDKTQNLTGHKMPFELDKKQHKAGI